MSFQPWLLAVLGHLLLIRGETEEATRTLEAAVASADSLGMRQFSIHARVLLACSRASGLEDALGARPANSATGGCRCSCCGGWAGCTAARPRSAGQVVREAAIGE